MGVDYILEKTATAHQDNRSMAKTQAELAYIREASAMEAPHNLHLYRLKRRKAEPSGSVLLGICPNGIELYEVGATNIIQFYFTFLPTST